MPRVLSPVLTSYICAPTIRTFVTPSNIRLPCLLQGCVLFFRVYCVRCFPLLLVFCCYDTVLESIAEYRMTIRENDADTLDRVFEVRGCVLPENYIVRLELRSTRGCLYFC